MLMPSRPSHRSALFFCAALGLTLLSGCSEQDKSAQLANQERISLTPELTNIYQQSCANCHENAATGAPVTGDTERWQIVFNKPFDLILSRVIDGYGGMPPLGQCFQCSEQQLTDLIHYMSRPANKSG